MTAAFSLWGVVKRYPGFQLGPLSMDLQPGRVLGYVGPNGSGKTTTMHCLVGLVRTDGGEIDIAGLGHDPRGTEWKTGIGYVGEEQVFYEHWTAERNLSFLSQFYPAWNWERVAQLAKRLNLPMAKAAKDLSTGNRVKLSLIAAMAHSPHLLLLDEPTSGLDPVVRSELLDVLFEFMSEGERSIFYSTHILSDISRIADELAFLDNGQLKLRETKDELEERWRRISFQSTDVALRLPAVASHKHEGKGHYVISFDREITLRQLGEMGVENVQEHRMAIDEIAVQIMKGGGDVADSEKRA